MTLHLYNTLSQRKERFEPINPPNVGIYLCGPTVYKPAHIGHAVGPVIFDVIKRYLTFKGFTVNWVVNITDVEDKLIAEAEAEGRTVPDLARELEQKYIDSISALGVDGIDQMPRASEHIKDIIDHIQQLTEKDAAYSVDGDVYFDVSRDDDYGKLTNRKIEEQSAGTRDGLVSASKRNPGDFALWKSAKPGEPAEVLYDSPWGKGRPGWHIECSAMAMRYLGQSFDIHGGGVDLKFPHHENEIAQAETATGKPFAKYWLHNGLTRFNTKKISKSDPEFERIMASLQLSNLLEQHPPELLRFLILQSHYRSPIDFSDGVVHAAASGYDKLCNALAEFKQTAPTGENGADQSIASEIESYKNRFLEAMDDDFNTASAIATLFEFARFARGVLSKASSQDLEAFQSAFELLGRDILGLTFTLKRAKQDTDGRLAELMQLVINLRNQARKEKDFKAADTIRDQLSQLGVQLEDNPDGTAWTWK